MISRRVFTSMMAGGLLAAPLAAEAQQAGRVYRVGLLSPGSPSVCTDTLRRGLTEQGYVEGRNVSLEPRWAEGDAERLPALAVELVQAKVVVIVAVISTAAKAAQQATATIPIVMVAVGDPVGLGLVASLARPGGNITGFTSFGPELNSKRMQLLKELIPSLKHAAILWTPTNPLHESSVKRTSETAHAVDVQLQPLKVTNADEIRLAIRTATQQHAGALIVLGDVLFLRNAALISALALEGRLPTTFLDRQSVEAGGLMSYGPKPSNDTCRRAAGYVPAAGQGVADRASEFGRF